ncbi:Orexin receptor type 2 [Zootermopsis nevadensis]|uniref:Orexin receptor type 2 n=1 Tax=Zootermopsis nevadensis TaxID=136037 RepID=A0A067R9B6_ZOONE|nr:Orexin receptor type 2 [Zootermopsis nevadensis]
MINVTGGILPGTAGPMLPSDLFATVLTNSTAMMENISSLIPTLSSSKYASTDHSDYPSASVFSSDMANTSVPVDHLDYDENSTDSCSNEYCISDDDYLNMIENHIFPTAYEWVLIAFHTVVFFVGLIGNALVCVAVYRNHSMRTVTNYFIVNLAVADFMVIFFCLPPTVVWDVTETWFMGTALCKIVLYFQQMLQSAYSRRTCSGCAFLEAMYGADSKQGVGFDGAGWWSGRRLLSDEAEDKRRRTNFLGPRSEKGGDESSGCHRGRSSAPQLSGINSNSLRTACQWYPYGYDKSLEHPYISNSEQNQGRFENLKSHREWYSLGFGCSIGRSMVVVVVVVSKNMSTPGRLKEYFRRTQRHTDQHIICEGPKLKVKIPPNVTSCAILLLTCPTISSPQACQGMQGVSNVTSYEYSESLHVLEKMEPCLVKEVQLMVPEFITCVGQGRGLGNTEFSSWGFPGFSVASQQLFHSHTEEGNGKPLLDHLPRTDVPSANKPTPEATYSGAGENCIHLLGGWDGRLTESANLNGEGFLWGTYFLHLHDKIPLRVMVGKRLSAQDLSTSGNARLVEPRLMISEVGAIQDLMSEMVTDPRKREIRVFWQRVRTRSSAKMKGKYKEQVNDMKQKNKDQEDSYVIRMHGHVNNEVSGPIHTGLQTQSPEVLSRREKSWTALFREIAIDGSEWIRKMKTFPMFDGHLVDSAVCIAVGQQIQTLSSKRKKDCGTLTKYSLRRRTSVDNQEEYQERQRPELCNEK